MKVNGTHFGECRGSEPIGVFEPFWASEARLVSAVMGVGGDGKRRQKLAIRWAKKKGSPVGADEPVWV